LAPIEVNRERLNGFRLEAQALSPRRFDTREAIHAAGWIPGRESAYLTLEARVEGFTREALDRLVFEERGFLEMATARGDSYVIPREMGPAVVRCPAAGQREAAETALARANVPESGRNAIRDALLMALADGPLPPDALLERMHDDPGPGARVLREQDALSAMLALLRVEGRVVRTKQEPPLDEGPSAYALTERVLPEVGVSDLAPIDALKILCAWYFRVHAPATPADFGWWSGAERNDVALAFREVKKNLRELRVSDLPYTYYSPPSRLDELDRYERTGAEPVVLTPFRDPWISSHEGRVGRFLRQEDTDRYPSGPALPAVVVSGQVAGRWEYDTGENRVRITWFRKPGEGVLERAERRALEIGTFLKAEMPRLRPLVVHGPSGRIPVYI
jgi:hypothetical protein